MQSINLVNGNIITLDKQCPIASAVYIENGKIKNINQKVKSDQTINLNRATVIPGFIDAHFHLKNYGKRLEQINLKGLTSLKEIEEIIIAKLPEVKPGDWILGFGWDQNLYPMENHNHYLFLLLFPTEPL